MQIKAQTCGSTARCRRQAPSVLSGARQPFGFHGGRRQMHERNEFLTVEDHTAAEAATTDHTFRVIKIIVAVVGERNKFICRGGTELDQAAAEILCNLPRPVFRSSLCGDTDDCTEQRASNFLFS